MGIFEYECPAGHITELMVRLENRPPMTECATCHTAAKFVVSATPTTFRVNDRSAFKRRNR